MKTDATELRASVVEAAKVDRDFNYIRPAGKRLSEYEAVNMYLQVQDGLFGSDGWFVRGDGGRDPWRASSTRLSHPHWFDFRDPAKLWQRTHTKSRAEEERAIERVTESVVSSGALAAIDPVWREEIVRKHYRVWSFVEYGIFKPFAVAQREALTEMLSSALVFEGLDRLRHAQSIVIWLMELETNVPGFVDEGGKDLWLSDPVYQPARRLVEGIMYDQWDWAELAVATNLVLDPILSEVGLFALLGRNGPFHGDLVTPVIVGTAERDRQWAAGWTGSLVRLVTGDDVPAAKENRMVIEEWIAKWTPMAMAAAEALAPVYASVPRLATPFADVLAGAVAGQRALLEGLGLAVDVVGVGR